MVTFIIYSRFYGHHRLLPMPSNSTLRKSFNVIFLYPTWQLCLIAVKSLYNYKKKK